MVAPDSINEDGAFTVPRTGMASCDGWAFDDAANSTPAEVWLELTNTQLGARHYWHAQRYSRPALAAALKIPSISNAGVGKVSRLSTYTKPPKINVP